MANQFWVWKKKNCSKKDIEWISMTGEEFYVFIRDPKNKDRCIIRLSDGGDSELDTIYIETNKVEYKKWRKEANHNDYLKKQNEDIEVVSAFTYEDDDDCSYYDRIQNEEDSLEEIVENIMMVGMLYDALKTLNTCEQKIVKMAFFDDLTVREIASVFNRTHPTIVYQIKKICKKLKKFFTKSKKSQQ